jgi:branched-chain amino acid aminotransferase
MNIVYLNNLKVEPSFQVSLFNASFLYGINVFEGIRAYWNDNKKDLILFDVDEHLDRLYNSLNFIGFIAPIKKENLKDELFRIIKNEGIGENVYIRITFFIDGDTSWSEKILIGRIISIRGMISNLGISLPQTLALSKYKRISSNSMPPFIKAGANYLNSRYALIDAQSRGFDGALFLSQQGFVSESTGSCVFFIKNGSFFTPSINSDILIGVTRNRVIQLSKTLGIPVYENNIGLNDLKTFEAAFLAGTMIELKSISKIEDIIYDLSHPLYTQLVIAFKKYVYAMEL